MGAGAASVGLLFHITRQQKMLHLERVPSFGGKCSSFPNYKRRVKLWRQITNLGPAKRASSLILRRAAVARQVCAAAGSDVIMDGNGEGGMLSILRDYFAPGAPGPVYQEVARSLQLGRTDQTTREYSVQFDGLCRIAESKMQIDGAFTEAFVSVLRMQNAAPKRSDRSPTLASVQGNAVFPAVARQMGRLSGPCGDRMFWRRMRMRFPTMTTIPQRGLRTARRNRKAKQKGENAKREEGEPEKGHMRLNGTARHLMASISVHM